MNKRKYFVTAMSRNGKTDRGNPKKVAVKLYYPAKKKNNFKHKYLYLV